MSIPNLIPCVCRRFFTVAYLSILPTMFCRTVQCTRFIRYLFRQTSNSISDYYSLMLLAYFTLTPQASSSYLRRFLFLFPTNYYSTTLYMRHTFVARSRLQISMNTRKAISYDICIKPHYYPIHNVWHTNSNSKSNSLFIE